MKKLNRDFLQGFWQITRRYWVSEEKWMARLLLGVIIALNLAHVYILVLFNEWNNDFYNALQNYDTDGYMGALKTFSILATVAIIIQVYALYLRQLLEIRWRRWLTREYLENWLEKRSYYQMQLLDNRTDNPDQRISEDLNQFVNLALRLSIGFLKATVTLCSFVAILWNLSGDFFIPIGEKQIYIPGYMVWLCVIYAVVGTWLTSKIGRPLVGLNFKQQQFEADFRFSLMRIRENTESIAFYGGEKQEKNTLSKRFFCVVENFRDIMSRQKKLTWFTEGYSQVAVIVPFVIAAPLYFSKKVQLGGLLQTASAFGRVQDALSFFVDNYSLVAEWQAVVQRLIGFNQSIDSAREQSNTKPIQMSTSSASLIQVSDLDVHLPKGDILLKNINLQIKAGDSVLIMGQSGCGKSTLMRTLAGIWPFGHGTISTPLNERLLFLPQRSYLPLGTLRECILYPYYSDTINDDQIRTIMELCDLGKLTDKLNLMEDWSHILSLGEQQKIAFVRAMLQQPTWLFLDEATSAIDESTEETLYTLLRTKLNKTAIVSVGHRSTLATYHDRQVLIDHGSIIEKPI